jgi:RHS repeat-associated protein
MTSSGTDGYTWDARNRLVSTLSGASFQYDAFKRRSSKNVGGTATNFLYDGVNAVQELSGTTPTANLLSGGVDELYERTDSSGMRSFLTDALGSTTELTDSTGAMQTQYTFDPFGNTSSTGTASTNSLAYTGRELDATGLYFYRARYYNPQLQRFMSEDPLGFGGGDTNLYGYVSDSPTNRVDPLGLYSHGGPGIAGVSSGMARGKGGAALNQLLDKLSACSEASAMVTDLKQLQASGKLTLTNLGAADGSTSFTGAISIDSTNGITAHNLGHEWWHTMQRDTILFAGQEAGGFGPSGGPVAGMLAGQLGWAGARAYNALDALLSGTPGFGPLDKEAEAIGQRISSQCGVD